MRISGVLSHPIVKPNLALNFRGEKGSLVLQYPDDRFDKSVDLDDNTKTFDKDVEISKCYSNIINKLDLVSPKDVENIANVISKKLDNKVPIDEIYDVLDILTQFADYKSIIPIKERFDDLGVNIISNLNSLHKYNDNLDNNPIFLTNVFNYIFTRNFDFKSDKLENMTFADKKATIIDKRLLDKIVKDKKYLSPSFMHDNIQSEINYPIYIKNFEKGYNFLNRSDNLVDFTVDIIQKAVALNNGKSLQENVEDILNAPILQQMESLGIKPVFIEFKTNDNLKKVTPQERIANNLNPKFISESDFKNFIDSISINEKESPEVLQEYYLNFLNKMVNIITPKDYSKYLQEIHTKLLDYLKRHNKDLEKVYFIIPSTSKSFAIANYQYQKINKMPFQNNLYYKFTSDLIKYNGVVSKLPENSTLIIVDDCAVTGASMTTEIFNYDYIAPSSIFAKKNIGIVFAPILISQNAMKRIQTSINKNHKTGSDQIIAGKILPEWQDSNPLIEKLYKFIVPVNTGNLTALVFPYMGPDTNCSKFIPLYEKFLLTPDAQKSTLDEFCIG